MSSDSCRSTREAIGSYVLGHLDERERARVEAHLEGCPECRAEADELKSVARALSNARPHPEPIRPPARLEERVLEGVARAARRERSRRYGRILGVAAVVAALAASVILLRESPPRSVDLASSRGVEGVAQMDARPWGTAIELHVTGLPEDEMFGVWLQDAAGQRTPAGTFRSVEGKELSVTLASSLPLSEANVIGVSNERGETVLRARL